jgi:hypothetical protein
MVRNMNKMISLVALEMCGLMLLVACASTTDQFETQVINGDYSKAIETYTTEIQGNTSEELAADEFLNTYLEERWDSYLAGELENSEFDVTMATYQKLSESIPLLDFTTIQQEYATVEQARENYADGLEALENKDYAGAVEVFIKIPETADSTYEEAQEQLEKATVSYCEEILKIASASVEEQDFDTAITLVQEAVNLVGTTEQLTDFLKETTTAKYEIEIAQAAKSSDFARVLSLYKAAASNSNVTISSTMTATYATSVEQYRQSIITRSIDTYKKSGATDARRIVDEGLEQLPQDDKLTTLAELYQSCVPVNFKDVIEISTYNMYDSDSQATDTFGNTIDASYYTRSMWTGTKSVTLYLNNRFTYLDISFIAEHHANTFEAVIYGDDVALARTGTVSGEDGITTLSDINVSGVEQLKVSITSIDGYSSIYMGDEQLYRVLTDKDFAEFL